MILWKNKKSEELLTCKYCEVNDNCRSIIRPLQFCKELHYLIYLPIKKLRRRRF